MRNGDKYMTNQCGMVRVIEYFNKHNVQIEFVNTGCVRTARADSIRNGQVKDPLMPSVYGIGFIGQGEYKSTVNYKYTPEYLRWQAMMRRCYSSASRHENKSYADCTVCVEWHDFQHFAEWYHSTYPGGDDEWHLDKDILILGNREYSPHSCMWVTRQQNASHANGTMTEAERREVIGSSGVW